MENMSEWIDIEIQKPEIRKSVLTYSYQGIYIGRWDDEEWRDQGLYQLFSVTHWMELPEGPIKNEKLA